MKTNREFQLEMHISKTTTTTHTKVPQKLFKNLVLQDFTYTTFSCYKQIANGASPLRFAYLHDEDLSNWIVLFANSLCQR